jgi:apolipoprotein N-acyltransferase
LRFAFVTGWTAGCAYFLVCVWWIGEPFQVDAANQGWMAPFAIAAMSMGLAVFWGCGALGYRLMTGAGRRSVGAVQILIFAGVFAAAEWLRGNLFTGFPWDLTGETWRSGSALSQMAAIVGAYGLTWITLAISSAMASANQGWSGRFTVAIALVALVAAYSFGSLRLAGAPKADPRAPTIRIVQADVKQESKYDPAVFNSIVARYISLTYNHAAPAPEIVIWPEGAIPAAMGDYLAPGTWTRQAIEGALSPGEVLMLGGYRVADADASPPIIFNSLAVLRRSNEGLAPIGLYDKYRLVPFGEFLPFDSLAARLGIKTFVHVGDGFTSGPAPRPLHPPGLPILQPLICYEAMYPGLAHAGAKSAALRASWIVNVSNDAWFGTTSGPWQSLNMAGYRAIEEGVPMVRATPTGVSAVIDSFGRISAHESLGQNAYGVIDARLPPALEPTPFSQLGDLPFAGMLLASLLAAAPWRWGRR